MLGSVLTPVAADAFRLNEAIEALRAYSLVRRDPKEKTLSIHRLVQAVVQDTLEKAERHSWAMRAMLAVNAAFPDVEHGTWPQCERLLTQALVAAQSIEHYQVISEEAGRVLNKIAAYLWDRARYAEAEPLYQRALHIWEQQLGPAHPDVAHSLNGLANLYRKQSKYAEAEPLYQRALRIREQQLGPEHPDVAYPLNGLASLYHEQGKYVEAESLYQRALHIRERALGSQHPDTAETMHDLARLREAQGSSEEARLWYVRALAVRDQMLGAHHPKTVDTRKRLIALLYMMGQHEEAARLEAEAALSEHDQ